MRLVRLLAGLSMFGAGEAMIVGAALGNSPWTVLAQGVARHTPLSIGDATIAISFAVLIVWIPLGQRPGLGTVLNAILVGTVIGLVLPLVPGHLVWASRACLALAGIGLISVGSGLYLTSRLGPGPRDGLMTGLHRRTGRSLRLVRAGIESSAVVVGFILGGRVGLGTLAFAALIGPGVQSAVHLLGGLDAQRPDLGRERPGLGPARSGSALARARRGAARPDLPPRDRGDGPREGSPS